VIDVRFSKMARRDLERVHAYYADRDPASAVAIVARVLTGTRTLGEVPRAGSASTRGVRRRWLVPRTPYVLIYRVERDHVRVVRVLHMARRIAGE
jgi:toxin ParE1/3/4